MTEKMRCIIPLSTILLLTVLCRSCHGQIPKDLIKRIQNLSAAEFLDQFVRLPQTGPLSVNSTSCHTGSQGQECSSSGRLPTNIRDTLVGNIAQPDVCGIHLVTVPVPVDPDPSVITFPTCVLLERCAGCTMLDHEECAPVDSTYVPLTILYTKYGVQDSNHFDYSETKTVYVEKHLHCESRCKVLPEDCRDNVHSHHDNQNCRCICRNAQEEAMCVAPKQWDRSRCECVCPRVMNCDTRRYTFNTDTCSCERRSLSSGRGLITSATDPDEAETRVLDEAAVERLRAMVAGNESMREMEQTTQGTTSTTTTATSTTTTATTTTATTTTEAPSTSPAEPCADTVCGDYWEPTVLTNGFCGCKPAFDFSFPGKK